MRHRFRSHPLSLVVQLVIGTTFASVSVSTHASAQQRDSTTQLLRLTREQAIRQALARNPTLAVAREQVSQARARVTQARALPEPSLGASIVGQPGAFRPRSGSEADLSVGITIPYPGKILLQGRAARGELGSVDETYTLQRQLVVFQTNQAYDSLLVSLKHRQDLEEARKLTQDFLTRPRRASMPER